MIKSYHELARSFTQTKAYTFGKRPDGTPLRLPVGIPLMGMAWFFGTFLGLLVISHILGISPIPKHAHGAASLGPTMLVYVGLPVLVAYVMTLAEVEGRRVHVLLRVWLRQSRDKYFIGGWLPTSGKPEQVRYREIHVRHRYSKR